MNWPSSLSWLELFRSKFVIAMFSFRFSLLESSGSGKSGIDVTSCRLHAETNILVTAYSNGVFVLHEVPSFSLIHNLRYALYSLGASGIASKIAFHFRVSEMQITSVAINNTGDWLALGCGKGSAAQLVVSSSTFCFFSG